jgi:hypothetical protein
MTIPPLLALGLSWGWWTLLGSLAVLICGLVAVWLIVRVQTRPLTATPDYVGPQSLFEELCQVHHLDPAAARTLKGMMTRRDIADPAILFVDPREFVAMDGDDEEALATIRRRIFGEGIEQSPTLRG